MSDAVDTQEVFGPTKGNKLERKPCVEQPQPGVGNQPRFGDD